MKNTFGQSVCVTLFGESHGPAVGVVIDGLAPGIEVSEEKIGLLLSRRRPSSAADTPRREKDEFRILSGAFNGKATGSPLCIVIPNENTQSRDYKYGLARPSHADFAAFCKYHGYEDYRGGGHFSGRVTAALVAAGGILTPALEKIGINIGTHILQCAGVSDDAFSDVENDVKTLKNRTFPTLDETAGERMTEEIIRARTENDSVGGITQTAICGLPSGVGEPWFDSFEGVLSHALFSLGGVKGIDFGAGFDLAGKRASECNDEFRKVNGNIRTETNNNGGINGGITNGMPVLFRCAVKPTASIARKQKTVDFISGENAELTVHGRHDPAIVRRICPVIDSVAAIVSCDLLAQRYGTDFLLKGTER